MNFEQILKLTGVIGGTLGGIYTVVNGQPELGVSIILSSLGSAGIVKKV